jgi:hypothetical protein
MMDWLKRNPLLGVLAAICVLLAVVIAVEAGFGATLREAMRPASGKPALPTDAKLLPPLVATAEDQAYPETTARPLFTPTRRPAPVVAAAPPSTIQRGQFVLAGVIAVGDQRTAMLREKANGRIHRVEKGKEVNGLKVTDIQREQVTLVQGGEEEVLTLSVLKPAPGTSLGAAPVQGPFGGVGAAPAAAPGSPAPLAVQPSGQAGPFSGFVNGPNAAPLPGVTAPPPPPGSAMGTNPAARGQPDPSAAAAPLSPEELLARRRARRTQQNQNQ